MALTLSTTGIVDGQVITAAQITQSINALTAAAAYDISISGSFSLIGNMTGSGIFQNAVASNTIKPQNIASSTQFTIPYLAATGSTSALYYATTGPKFNPVTETLTVTNFAGTASAATSSSYAVTASYAETAINFIPSFVGIDNVTYTASTSPYLIDGNAPFNVYVSQSALKTLGLRFTSAGVTSGKQVNFTPQYQSTTLNTTFIAISASGVDVYGINSNVINAGSTALANTLGIGDVYNLTFQYIGTGSPPVFPTVGWYLINVNQS